MRAVQFAEYGDSDVLQTVETVEPHAGSGQVRIAVRAAGVNAIDWKIRSGLIAQAMPRPLPSGIGMDAAGVVDEVGDGVTDVAVGDEVLGIGSATYAQYAVLTSWAANPPTWTGSKQAGSRSRSIPPSAASTSSASPAGRPC